MSQQSTKDNYRKINGVQNCLDLDIGLKNLTHTAVLTTAAWHKMDDSSRLHWFTQKFPFIKPNLQCQLSATFKPCGLRYKAAYRKCPKYWVSQNTSALKRMICSQHIETIQNISSSDIWLLRRNAHTHGHGVSTHWDAWWFWLCP